MSQSTNHSDEERRHQGIDPTNYANNDKVVREAVNEIIGQHKQIVGDRAEFNRDLLRYWDLQAGVNNSSSKVYEDQGPVYIPRASDALETIVEQVTEGSFPSSEQINIRTNREDIALNLNHIVELLLHDIEEGNLQLEVPQLIRQGLFCGASPLKVDWHEEEVETLRPRAQLRPDEAEILGGQIVSPESGSAFLHSGPRFQVVDLLRWYVWPTTIQHLHEAHQIFERCDKTWREIMSMGDKGKFHKPERIKDLAPQNDDEIQSRRDERMEKWGVDLDQDEKRKKGIFELTETYSWMKLPGHRREVPVQIISYGKVVLSLKQVPFWHQRSPYFMFRPKSQVDWVYGKPIASNLEYPQYAANALVNLAIENALQINAPMLGVWSARLGIDVSSMKMGHGQVFETDSSPNDVMAWHRPPDVINSTFFMANALASSIEDLASAPPILQGKVGRQSDTATEASLIARGASAGVRSMIRTLEKQVMTPLLKRIHQLSQQYRSLQTREQIANSTGLDFPPEILAGDVSMKWMTNLEVMAKLQEALIAQQANLPQGNQAQIPQQQPVSPAQQIQGEATGGQPPGANADLLGQLQGLGF